MRPRQGQTLNVRAYTDASTAPPVAETDDLMLIMQFVQILWNRKWTLALTLVLGALAGLGFSLWTVPMYSAKTSLEIQNLQDPLAGRTLTVDPTFATQLDLLKSGAMRSRAASNLLAAAPEEPVRVVEPLAPLRRFIGMKDPAESVDWPKAVGMAAATLTVKATNESRLLDIVSFSANPKAAADFTNMLAKEYIQNTSDQRWESYKTSGEFLTRAKQELKLKLESSEQKLADFARSTGLVFTGETQNIAESKLTQLQDELTRATADRIHKQAVYDSSTSTLNPTESLPSVLDNGPMGKYQSELSDLRKELAKLNTTFTPSHNRIQQVQAQIDELEKTRSAEQSSIKSRMKIEYETAIKRETDLRREFEGQRQILGGQADNIIQYNLLKREVDSNKSLYETTLQEATNTNLATAMRTSSAQIIDTAQPSASPVSPNLPLNLTLGMMGGMFFGALFVVIRSRSDVSIRAPGVMEVHLNLRELGVIPTATTDPGIKRLPSSPRAARSTTPTANGGFGRTMLSRGGKDSEDCLELVTWNRKPSIISEAFRATMTSILFSGENGERPRVILITSPSPQEGKSTVISNLAIALAEINHRVLLIDADMRLPRLHTIFNLPNTFGLADILHERTPVEEYPNDSIVRKTHIPNLYVLPAGPARANLSPLLYSNRMKELMMKFGDSFDTVLIDSPPVLSIPDARILSRSADAVILVVRAHRTHQEAAFAAAKCFEDDGRRLLGTILNDWDPKVSGGYGQYHSYYTYSGS